MTGALSRLNIRPTRGVAFGIHLALSLLVFSSLVAMMLLFWFPGELFFIDGGWQGLKLVAMVDLVLGPALTLVLFKPGKPKLLMDMAMIAGLQIAALAYGFHTTHQQRTVAIVFAENGFNTLSARDKLEADRQLAALDLQPQKLPPVTLLKLPLVLTPDPKPEEYGQHLEDILNGYPGPQQRSDQYVPLASHHELMQEDALSVQQLADRGALRAVEKSLVKRSLDAEDVEFYRFKARYADGIAIFDPDAVRIVDYVTYESPVIAAASS
ncbi:MAG: hypothetical protein HKN42_10775 [Granulosicoccus sp.]|nr:hypothetical protein [Granulosicoccus sp.]